MSSEETTEKLSSDVRFRLIDGEAVLLRQNAGEVLVFNEVASRILALVAEGSPKTTIVEELLLEFDAERSQVVQDVESFLAEMREEGILAHSG